VRTVIREVCAACDSPLHETCTDGVETLPAGVELDLAGAHQVGNALVAIRGLEILTNTHSELHADIHAGLAKTRQLAGLRARCEVLSESPLIVVDVAHNPEGIRAALRCTRELGAGLDELYVLIAVAADKDVSGILDALADASATIIPVEVENERILRASDLANRARDKGLRILEIDGLEEALEHFSEHLGHNGSLLATGSHYVVGTMPSGMFETRPH
jgi:dihydrofolate synthase/folylpolyglutamate synthase